MNPLQIQFIGESRELLEGAGEALLRFEKAPEDLDNLNSLFRQVHTLKGNCGLFDELSPLGVALHAAEETLDQVRAGKHQLGGQDTDLLMEAMDFVIAGIDDWEAGTFQPAVQLSVARKLADRIVSARAGEAQALPAHIPDNEALDRAASASGAEELQPWFTEALSALPGSTGRLVCGRYTPEPDCFFKGEDPLQLVFNVPDLVFLDVKKLGAWAEPSSFDCYQCQVEIRFVSTAPLAPVQQVFDYVAEQLVLTEVSNTESASPVLQATQHDPLPESVRQGLLKVWQSQATMLSMVLDNDPAWKGRANAAVATVSALAKSAGRPEWAEAARAILAVCLGENSIQPLQAWVAKRPAELDPPAIAPQQARPAHQAVVATSTAQPSPAGTPEADPKGISVLKVPREKIDRLMELIGEMVVAKNALPYLANRAENDFSCRELAREIKANHSVINRIAEEMQDAIMQVRMLPVGTVFQRFPRLVRDLSKKLGKQVRLDITGEDTEADKNMIESLSEPLIHLLRNSLDHGIESPETRVAAGKSAEGLIAIHAWQDADRVHISIRDDGAGMDPQRLKQKALEKSLLPAEKLELMSEKELYQLIFRPGFSTADQISDVSGRGVGMDVVRSAIARVGGQVDLQSSLGEGTTLTLSLPLSMAVNKVMMIEVAGQQFGLPMEVVVETVRVPLDAIHHIQDQQATVLRGKIIPLFALHGFLGLAQQPRMNEQNELAVLVTRVGHDTVGVVVDDFDSTIDILLRPLDGVLTHMHQYAGSALLGDGSVLLILNLMEMMTCQ